MQKLIGSALLGALLVGCGGPAPSPAPSPGTPTYSVSGQVLLPGAGAASLTQGELEALWALPHVPGEVLVRDAGEGGLGAQALSVLSGVTLQAVPGTDLSRATTPAGERDEAFAQRLAAAGLEVQPNLIYRPLAVPNDPGFPLPDRRGVQVGTNFYDQDYLTRIRALEGWNRLEALGRPKSGVLTAVLDTGVDRTHPELRDRLRPGRDFCSQLVLVSGGNYACQGQDDDPAEATAGDVGHGTGVAGIIAANTNNGDGIAALTWGGTVLPVKVFGAGAGTVGATSASLAAGLNYAVAQGARVINLSLGFGGENGQLAPADPEIARALAAAAQADAVVVAAAGNTPNDGLYYPASDPNVLAVGAIGRGDTLACYSARPRGNQRPLDIVAPGGDSPCTGTTDFNILTLTASSLGGYALRVGTSEAAPQVSGTASLLRGAFPSLTAAQVRQALTAGARQANGQRILDVAGAVAQAERLTTAPTNRAYTLVVEARRGGSAVTTKTFTGTLSQGQRAINYSLNGLAAGSYTLTARVTLNNPNETAAGTRSVQVSGNLSGVDIQTQR
ncbi:S8 family serine peptidase [Deinococcus sp. NW-56]|uniref:S8 family peptidase n=1 Tax=Deinococcus sp. NW-56 TaxID=2080419 RepID=UPI001319C855|nr:S8 family serine peptidase [Deinococcus sp. NW-56]